MAIRLDNSQKLPSSLMERSGAFNVDHLLRLVEQVVRRLGRL